MSFRIGYAQPKSSTRQNGSRSLYSGVRPTTVRKYRVRNQPTLPRPGPGVALPTRRRKAPYRNKRKVNYRTKRNFKRKSKFNNKSREVVVREGKAGLPDRILATMQTSNHDSTTATGTIRYAFVKGNNINACMTGWFSTAGNNPNGFSEKYDTYRSAIVKASAIKIRVLNNDATNMVLGLIIPCTSQQLPLLQTATNLRQLEALPHAKLYVIKAGAAGDTIMQHYMRTSQVLFNKNKKMDLDVSFSDYSVTEGQAATVDAWSWFVAFQNIGATSDTVDFQTTITHYTEFYEPLVSTYFTLPQIDINGNDIPRELRPHKEEKKSQSVTLPGLSLNSEIEYEMIKVPKVKSLTPASLSKK